MGEINACENCLIKQEMETGKMQIKLRAGAPCTHRTEEHHSPAPSPTKRASRSRPLVQPQYRLPCPRKLVPGRDLSHEDFRLLGQG